MSGFTLGWALGHELVSTPAEKLVLYGIAGTSGTDNCMGEIRLDELMDFACLSEEDLRATLNSLTEKKIISNVRPSEGQPTAANAHGNGPRVFDCDLNTPREHHFEGVLWRPSGY